MTDITLLIADDQPLTRNGLAALLHAEEGFRVIATAQNGAEALDASGRHRPLVVLMDIHMPEMDGITAARRIKDAYPETLIIMLTTFADEDYIWKALQAGAVGYMLKDMETDEMVRLIRDCVAGRMNYPASIQEKLRQAITGGIAPASGDGSQEAGWEAEFSPREREIVRLLMEGYRNSDIAEKLFLSEGTVKNYVGGIYRKMNVSRRGEAMVWLRSRMDP